MIRGREMRTVAEARRSLTKFISTIAIAIFIESLVIVFKTTKDHLPDMLYPTALLLTAIVIVVGLGAYQRMSADVGEKSMNRTSPNGADPRAHGWSGRKSWLGKLEASGALMTTTPTLAA